ncbi:hypothetical protein [Okeania sp. SIO2B3]|uniref:hypothetical protein n=1 Tax=Okeania sp. SIO2B3 TaxID=2607784 RepID=UPI0013C09007|nr:hypothetical protein [Okeania sp. SIO2B3]NET40622.1 hypothetical protein [Okeania sp. SIO2B3]
MPGKIQLTRHEETIAMLHKIAIGQQKLVDVLSGEGNTVQVSVKELATPAEEVSQLLVGSTEMKFFYGQDGSPYPDELQPLVEPLKNTFNYEQVRVGSDLFYIEGEYEAMNIAQLPTTVLDDYNSNNGTSYTAKSKTEEYLRIPLMRFAGSRKRLDSDLDHLWVNTQNGDEIDWLEPLDAFSLPSSDLIKLRYDEEDGRYPVLFGDNLTWNVKIKFSGLIKAYMPEEMVDQDIAQNI